MKTNLPPKNKHILITGGAGFIGSNFISYYLEKHTNDHIINLDKLTYAGELSNLSDVANHPNYTFVKGDICDRNFIFGFLDINKYLHSDDWS